MLSVTAALLIGCLVVTMFLYDYFTKLQKEQLRETLNFAVTSVERLGTDYLGKVESDRYRLTLIAPDGNVLADTKRDASTLENHADRIEIHDALSKGEGESVRYSSTLLEKTIYFAKKIENGDILRISVSRATVGLLLVGMFWPTVIILFAAFLITDFLARRLAKKIVEPLDKLDLDHPLENDTYDELSPLLCRVDKQREAINSKLRELHRRTDEFTQITSNLREGLVLLDKNGIILSVNPTAKKLFKADDNCIGSDFLTVDRTPETTAAIKKAVAEGHSELIRNFGDSVWQLDISRIDSDSEHIGSAILAFDVTERERAESARREFTANVSHELKTPLQGIIGSVGLIENGMVKSEDLPRFVGHIHSEATRLLALIGDIIKLSGLDEGIVGEKVEVDLLTEAKSAADRLAEKAKTKDITLEVSGKSASIQGSKRLIAEIFENLIDNAIKYNVDGGKVMINVGNDESGVTASVSDTGTGIPKSEQPHVFERFYRVDKSRAKDNSSEPSGTGLGLSIVKHAVICLGGKISLESEVGKGTTVKIVFKK